MPRNNDHLLIGGFGQPAQNVDATGRRIRDNTPPPVPEYKHKQINHTIDSFLQKLQQEEGGFNEGKTDLAGPTNIGINLGTLKEFEFFKKSKGENLPSDFTSDVKRVTLRLARQIYDEMFYKRYNIDKVADENTAGHLLDMSVNPGPGLASRWYQQELNDRLGTNLDIDGITGPDTRNAIEKAKNKDILREIQNAVVNKRKAYYIDLARRVPSQKDKLKGWLERSDRYIVPPLPARKPEK